MADSDSTEMEYIWLDARGEPHVERVTMPWAAMRIGPIMEQRGTPEAHAAREKSGAPGVGVVWRGEPVLYAYPNGSRWVGVETPLPFDTDRWCMALFQVPHG